MSTRRLLPSGLATIVALSAVVGLAEEATLDIQVSPTSLQVGDHVETVVSARGGEDLLWGELTVALKPDGPWALVDGPSPVAGARPPAWKLVLAPLNVGELELPGITVSARPADGDAVKVACPSPPTVTVVSVLSGEEGDTEPAPLRDPIGVRGPPWEWILPVCCIALPLLAATAWWWRRRGSAVVEARPALPPLAELEAMAGELLARIGREPADGICDRLAAGLRRYLERRTGEPAEEMTSFELRLLARRRGWPESVQRLVQQVMALADGVRFGRRPATDSELEKAIGLALDAARGVEAFLQPVEGDASAERVG